MGRMRREAAERAGQLQTLVRDNFDRFISCKNIIDGIYLRMQKSEAESAGVSAILLKANVERIQQEAAATFGPLLERQKQASGPRLPGLLPSEKGADGRNSRQGILA